VAAAQAASLFVKHPVKQFPVAFLAHRLFALLFLALLDIGLNPFLIGFAYQDKPPADGETIIIRCDARAVLQQRRQAALPAPDQ